MHHDDEEIAIYAARIPVINAAWAFTRAYWIDHDMRTAWRATHPTLRRCWTQAWLTSRLEHACLYGRKPDDIVEAFTQDDVDHELWEPFARTQINNATLPITPDTWGIGINPTVVAPDMTLVHLIPTPPQAAGNPGQAHTTMPLLMQYTHPTGWRLLNFFSERIPEPGWPPHLTHP